MIQKLFLAIFVLLASTGAVDGETVFYDDFSDGDAMDGSPVTWNVLSGFENGDFFVNNDGDFVLFPNSDRDTLLAYVDRDEVSLTDVSIRSQFRSAGPIGSIGLLVRGDTDDLTAYDAGYGNIPSGEYTVGVGYDMNGFHLLAESDSPYRPWEEDVILQLDAFGDELSVYYWPAGQRMPDEPLAVAHDQQFSEGIVAVYQNPLDGNPVVFRYVHVSDTPIRDPSGDFDSDGVFSCDDIDLLYAEVEAGEHPYQFDMNNDLLVDDSDISHWLVEAGNARGFTSAIQPGDTDLDGLIDAADLNSLGLNWQAADTTSWCQGDFNHDLQVGAADLNQLALNWQSDITSATASAPEPSTAILGIFSILAIACLRQRSF